MKINRLNDLFFKYLLGSDERKDLTLKFLDAILADGDRRFLELSKLKISDVKQLKRGELWGAYFSGKCTEKELEKIAMHWHMLEVMAR